MTRHFPWEWIELRTTYYAKHRSAKNYILTATLPQRGCHCLAVQEGWVPGIFFPEAGDFGNERARSTQPAYVGLTAAVILIYEEIAEVFWDPAQKRNTENLNYLRWSVSKKSVRRRKTCVALYKVTGHDACLYSLRDGSSFTWHQQCNNQTEVRNFICMSCCPLLVFTAPKWKVPTD